MAQPEGNVWRGETVGQDKNLLFEMLKRVDPKTLATASCVSCDFRSVSEDESLWEKVCNDRWPSTKNSAVKSILSSVGGYRKTYAHCFPSIVNKEERPVGEKDKDQIVKQCDLSPSDLIFIVDVLHKDQPVYSTIVEGIPGADGLPEWFSACPFRVDLLEPSGKCHEGRPSVVVIGINLPSMTSLDTERKFGKVWKALQDSMKVSWIMINKKTKQMTNLSSWRPVGGTRHWPSDEVFLLRFGSILPAMAGSGHSSTAVRCDIVMKFTLKFGELTEDTEDVRTPTTLCRLTELSLQLEIMGGPMANGKESIGILHRALSTPKSMNHGEILDSYDRYLKVQTELIKTTIRDEYRLNNAIAIIGICSSLFLFILWLFHQS